MKQSLVTRTAKALQSQYDKIAKAKEDDPELGRYAKKVCKLVQQEFLDNCVATSVSGFPGSLYGKSNELEELDLDTNNKGTDNKKELSSRDDNEKAAKMKHKKHKKQLQDLKERRESEKKRRKKEDALLYAAAKAMTGFQGGKGMNEKIVKQIQLGSCCLMKTIIPLCWRQRRILTVLRNKVEDILMQERQWIT